MVKKILFLTILVASVLISGMEFHKPKMVFLSIGVNSTAVREGKSDTYVREAKYLLDNVEQAVDSVYALEKHCLYHDKATRKACLDGLDWAVRESEKGDLIVVYIGAHGLGGAEGNYEFHAADDKIVAAEIIERLEGVKSNLLLLVDTCHSGAMLIDWQDHGENVFMISSSGAEQTSAVWKFVKPLSEAVLEADYNRDKIIDLDELGKFVTETMSDGQKSEVSGKSKKIFCEKEKRYILPHYDGQSMLTEQLKQAIRSSGKTVCKISEESGVPQPVLSRFMTGKRGMTLETAEKLASCLRLSLKPAE